MKKKTEQVESVKKDSTIFEHLKYLSEVKKPFDEDDSKEYKNYMINRYVSMCDLYVPLVNEINRYDVPEKINYEYYVCIIPKRKQYFNYIKKGKDDFKTSRINIQRYFGIGSREANEYLKILSEDQIDQINKKFMGGKVK